MTRRDADPPAATTSRQHGAMTVLSTGGESIGEQSIGGKADLSDGSPTYVQPLTLTYAHGLRGKTLKDWDTERDLAFGLADHLGISRLGHVHHWEVGGARLRVEVALVDDSLRWSVRILDGWPTSPPRRTLALHEAFAIQTTGRFRKLSAPEASRWKLRMLVELRSVDPVPVQLAALPAGAPDTAHLVWREVDYLLGIRRLTEALGTPFPLSAPWLAEWSGGRLAQKEAIAGRVWLDRHRFLVRDGQLPGRSGGRPLTLWQAVDPDTGSVA